MNSKLRKWLPIALCCLPGVTLVVIVGIGPMIGSADLNNVFGGPAGIGLITLALLVCPVGVGLIARRQVTQHTTSAEMKFGCYVPEQTTAATARDLPSERLAALRKRRETLEREVQKEW